MWTVIAQGSLEEFQAAQPEIGELPKGTKLKLEIDTSPWPVAPLADLWGAEWVAERVLNEAGAEIVDVEGVSWTKIIVWMKADPAWVMPLIYTIAAILVTAGLAYIVHEIKLSFEKAPLGMSLLSIAAIASGAFLIYALVRRR